MGASLDYLARPPSVRPSVRSFGGLFAAAAAAALWGLRVTTPPPPIHFTLGLAGFVCLAILCDMI